MNTFIKDFEDKVKDHFGVTDQTYAKVFEDLNFISQFKIKKLNQRQFVILQQD
jgi:hypothetical protein